MRLMVVLLPQPDGPNKATMPGVGASNATLNVNASKRFWSTTSRLIGPNSAAPGAQTIPTTASRRVRAPPT